MYFFFFFRLRVKAVANGDDGEVVEVVKSAAIISSSSSSGDSSSSSRSVVERKQYIEQIKKKHVHSVSGILKLVQIMFGNVFFFFLLHLLFFVSQKNIYTLS